MKRKRLTTTHIILFSFLAAIFVGSGLLVLPIASATGVSVPYIDALFTATTATCVTGLVTLPTVTAWSGFGQAVILVLIQIGGIGIITVMSGIMILVHRRMGLSDRLLLQDAFNLNSYSGVIRFVKKVISGTFAVEGVGALLYMTVFVPQFGVRGIWISIFNAVSAFCNAGIDIIGTDSLCAYATHPLINGVTMALIILGGIGYIVWWDVLNVWRGRKKHLMLHSKIALMMTLFLIVGGAAAVLAFEYNNPATIGDMNLWDKIQVSLFQSVTTRTAGFMTVPQENLTNGASLVSLLLMMVGGSPVGTAGGIKTVTLVVLAATALSTVRNREEVVLFDRSISGMAIRKALAVTGVFSLIVIVSAVALAATTQASLLDILYEAVSATATVGLSRNLTFDLNVWGKWIVIVTMYLGRVGPISLAIAFAMRRRNPNIIKNPTEEIHVG
jgi:trk system potassium uptake protein TrkH